MNSEIKFFALAVLATIFWGFSDVFFKKSTDPRDPFSHLKILIVIGFFMGLQAFYELFRLYQGGGSFSLRSIWIYIPISFLYIVSMGIDFYGYRYLRISIGSPTASTSGVVAGLLSWLLLGSDMSLLQFIAIATIGSGLVLLAYFEYKDQEEGKLGKNEILKLGASALIFPLTYMVVDALATFLDEHYMTSIMNETQALISFELTFLLVGLLSLIYLFVVKKHRYSPFKTPLLLGGISETAGQFFYVFALAGDGVVTAPIMSLDCIVASLFGVLLLKEKIRKRQKLTIVMIALAVFVLGFFE